MIVKFTEDDDSNTVIEFDEEGIFYLIEGLMQLDELGPGKFVTTPAVWTKSTPWWRFWNRKGEPVVGEVILRRVG